MKEIDKAAIREKAASEGLPVAEWIWRQIVPPARRHLAEKMAEDELQEAR